MENSNQQATEQALQDFCAKAEQSTSGEHMEKDSPAKKYSIRLAMARLRDETDVLTNIGEEDAVMNTLKNILGDLHDSACRTAYDSGYCEGLDKGYKQGYRDGHWIIDF